MTRYAKKTDGNQKEIVDALRKYGVQVVVTNFGNDFPDLLCGYGDWFLLEVKEPDGSIDRGQLKFFRDAEGIVGIVTDPDEAITFVQTGTLDGTSSEWGRKKDAIAQWLIKNPTQQSLSVRKFRKVIQ